MIEITTKKCVVCGEIQTVDNFFRRKDRKSEWHSWCKACSRKRARISYHLNAEQYIKMKRIWRANNPQKVKAIKAKWRNANIEKDREYGREYRRDNLVKCKDACRKWRIANPDYSRQWYQENLSREQKLGRDRAHQFRKENPVIAHIRDKRQDSIKAARHRNAVGTWTKQEWLQLCEKYNETCLCCGKINVALTVDHVIPLSAGGTNYIWNIQPLCFSCNVKKHTRTDDYRYSHRFDVLEIAHENTLVADSLEV